MPLYCYIVETGYYEDREANIVGHATKYSQEEFDNICIEIAKKHGDVEEVEYFSSYDTSDVTQMVYNIDSEKLIKYLVVEHGFVKLDVPVNDGHNIKEFSRVPVEPENLVKVQVVPLRCPENMEYTVKKEMVKKDFPKPEYVNRRCMLNEFMPVMANTKEDNSKKPYVDCGYCDYHDYDWRDEGDEFEVCHKGHELYPKECKDFKEL